MFPTPARILRRWRVFRAQRAFDAVVLGAGDLCIDCGANVGVVADRMAASGAKVVAFEPNPAAFAVLSKRFAGNPLVTCNQAAVGDLAGRTRLFMHRNASVDPVAFSTGSSVLSDKPNVDPGDFVEVDVVDLGAFILGCSQPITILKIDIEGAEYTLLPALVASGAIGRIRHVFVETHAHRMPGLRDKDLALRRMLRDRKITNCSLDWD